MKDMDHHCIGTGCRFAGCENQSPACRCGWDGTGEHPCHARGYSCRKPAKRRLYNPGAPFALSGVQFKLIVAETWACDECWGGGR